jgi:hypothetical protein
VLLDERPVDDDHMGFADHTTHSGEPIQRKPLIQPVRLSPARGNEIFRPISPEICVVSMIAHAITATTRTLLIRGRPVLQLLQHFTNGRGVIAGVPVGDRATCFATTFPLWPSSSG